jgi:hypothetical protein
MFPSVMFPPSRLVNKRNTWQENWHKELLQRTVGRMETQFIKKINSDSFTNLPVVTETVIMNALQNTTNRTHRSFLYFPTAQLASYCNMIFNRHLSLSISVIQFLGAGVAQSVQRLG